MTYEIKLPAIWVSGDKFMELTGFSSTQLQFYRKHNPDQWKNPKKKTILYNAAPWLLRDNLKPQPHE